MCQLTIFVFICKTDLSEPVEQEVQYTQHRCTEYRHAEYSSTDLIISNPWYFRFYPRWKEWEVQQALELDYTLDEAQLAEDWAGLLNLVSILFLYNFFLPLSLMMRHNKLEGSSLETLSSQFLEFEGKVRAHPNGAPFRCFLLSSWCYQQMLDLAGV